MSPVNQPNSNNPTIAPINLVNAEQLSIIDLTLVTGLNRSDFLEQEIRDVSDKMEKGNEAISRLNSIIGKARIGTNENLSYAKTTWSVTEDKIKLSNGYSISFNQTDSGIQLSIDDSAHNQMFFQNGVLVPTPALTGVDALEVGIPIMSDTSIILEDGTSITFTTNPLAAGDEFNQDNLSGGLAQVSTISIQRGNQSLQIHNANTQDAIIGNAKLNVDLQVATYNNQHPDDPNYKDLNFGHVLLENGGLHSWEYNGQLVENITHSQPGETENVEGLFARKLSFKDSVTNTDSEYNAKTFLTADDKKLLQTLDITYSDASDKGLLTKEEWVTLIDNALEKRNSLSSTSQYDYLNLQRATGKLVTQNEYLMGIFKQMFAILKEIGRM